MRLQLAFCALLAGCGGGTATVSVELSVSEVLEYDPYRSSDRLTNVRVTIDGPERHDDAVRDVPLDGRRVQFEEFPTERAVTITARGFDRAGTLIAFGRAEGVQVDDDVSVTIPFRRSVAFVTHQPICGGGCGQDSACADAGSGFRCEPIADTCTACSGEGRACVRRGAGSTCARTYERTSPAPGLIYVIDLVTRALVKRIPIPGVSPRAHGITARGGDALVVTYSDASGHHVGWMSLDREEWTSIPIERPADLAVLGRGPIGVAAGGGAVTIFDAVQKKVVLTEQIGGRVLDAAIGGETGQRAILVTSVPPGLVLIDLERADSPSSISSPGEVRGASGVALSEDGKFAFVTSSERRDVVTVDLQTGALATLPDGFSGPVDAAVYSDAMRSVLAIQRDDDEGIARVLAYSVLKKVGSPATSAVGTLPAPSGIAAGPGGRRLVVVSAGTSTQTAGLTVIDADLEDGFDGSTVSYPLDPDDTFVQGSVTGRQRYQPSRVAIVYGQ